MGARLRPGVLAVLAATAAGCGQADRVLDARLDPDRMLVRDRTEERPGVVLLRNGEEMHALSVDLQPERTRWTTPGEDGTPVRVDAPTVNLRSIRISAPRPPLWKHLAAGAALGVLVGRVLATDFEDGGSNATVLAWGGGGLVAGGLGGLAPRFHTYGITGGHDPAPPPPR